MNLKEKITWNVVGKIFWWGMYGIIITILIIFPKYLGWLSLGTLIIALTYLAIILKVQLREAIKEIERLENKIKKE